MYCPFLSLPTASTSTRRVSVRMRGGAPACGCASCAGDAIPASKPAAVRIVIERIDMQYLSVGNVDGAVLRRHQLAFGIPDHQPHRIVSGLDIETGADGQAPLQAFFQRLIFETHLELLLIAGHVDPVAVE